MAIYQPAKGGSHCSTCNLALGYPSARYATVVRTESTRVGNLKSTRYYQSDFDEFLW